MLDDDRFFARISIELMHLNKEEPSFKPVDNNFLRLRGLIMGSGLYSGGKFEFEISIGREFPFEPPKITPLTPIWHPNFADESICIGIIGKEWRPNIHIFEVISTIRYLLANPNPDDYLNSEAALMIKENLDGYKEKVREYVQKYAKT